MRSGRRRFMGGVVGTGAAGLTAAYAEMKPPAKASSGPDARDLDRVAAAPVLKREGFTSPVIVDSTTVHISGGFGFVYMLHFASCVPDIGRYQEYKLGLGVYGSWLDPPITVKDGKMTVPSGPGVGIKDLKALLSGAVEA